MSPPPGEQRPAGASPSARPSGPASPSGPSGRSARVVLLDRDGTVVVDRDYLSDPAGLTFLPGAAEGLRQLHRRGHPLVIISNQSGVGRGLFSLRQLQAVNERLEAMVLEIGAELAGIYCCPHRPEDGCECRKPAVGLVHQAAGELGFDPAAAIVIGDKTSDVELGRAIGAVTIRIGVTGAPALAPGAAGVMSSAFGGSTPGSGTTARERHYVAADLLRAAQIIERL